MPGFEINSVLAYVIGYIVKDIVKGNTSLQGDKPDRIKDFVSALVSGISTSEHGRMKDSLDESLDKQWESIRKHYSLTDNCLNEIKSRLCFDTENLSRFLQEQDRNTSEASGRDYYVTSLSYVIRNVLDNNQRELINQASRQRRLSSDRYNGKWLWYSETYRTNASLDIANRLVDAIQKTIGRNDNLRILNEIFVSRRESQDGHREILHAITESQEGQRVINQKLDRMLEESDGHNSGRYSSLHGGKLSGSEFLSPEWIQTYYNNIERIVTKKNCAEFTEICGPDAINKTYIRPKTIDENGNRRPLWEMLKLAVEDNENDGYVHTIIGGPGQGKSLFCLYSVYEHFTGKKTDKKEDDEQNIACLYKNILWFTLDEKSNSNNLKNNILDSNNEGSSLVDAVVNSINKKVIQAYIERNVEGTYALEEENDGQDTRDITILFIDGFDDLLFSYSDINSSDFIKEIRTKVNRFIISYSAAEARNIRVFLTARKNSVDIQEDERDLYIEIDSLKHDDRENWYQAMVEKIERDISTANKSERKEKNRKRLEQLHAYWNVHIKPYNEEADKEEKDDESRPRSLKGTARKDILGSPFLFRIVMHNQIENLESAGDVYSTLCDRIKERLTDVRQKDRFIRYHSGKAFELYKISYSKKDSSFEDSTKQEPFDGNVFRKFIYKAPNGKTDFYHHSFRDYFLARFFYDELKQIENETDNNEKVKRAKKFLAHLAYGRFGKSKDNMMSMLRDLLKAQNSNIWEYVFKDVLLKRLSVVNNSEIKAKELVIIATDGGKEKECTANIEDTEHTDDLSHNYSMREYNNIFCNAVSLVSLQDNCFINLGSEDIGRLSYLFRLFECDEIVLRPFVKGSGMKGSQSLDMQRAIMKHSLILNEKIRGWNMRGADFTAATFSGTIIGGESDLTGCTLSKTIFHKGMKFLADTILEDILFEDCILEDVSFGEVDEEGAREGIYYNITFRKCSFSNVQFHNCAMGKSIFEKCKMKDVEFKGVKGLLSSSFLECEPNNVIFEGKICEYDFHKVDEEADYGSATSVLAINIKREPHIEKNYSFIKDVKSYLGKSRKEDEDKKDYIIDYAVFSNDPKYDFGIKDEYEITRLTGRIGETIYRINTITQSCKWIDIECDPIVEGKFEEASRQLSTVLQELKRIMERNGILNVRLFYKGPFYVPIFVGRILGNSFNIYVYQSQPAKTTDCQYTYIPGGLLMKSL